MKPTAPRADARATFSLPQPQGRGANAIAAHLRSAILGGTYSVGDRLPPERDIARAVGASRTTIRNALRLLEDEDLVEVRAALEPHMVRLAVLNGKPRDLDRLWHALAELERAGPDADRFSRCDQRFHLALAQATHNPLLIWIYHQVNRIRSHRHWVAVQHKVLMPPRIAAYNDEHRALVEAISARDGERAVEIIQRHLQAARRDLLGAQAG